MPVVALVDAACPAALKISRDPSAVPGWCREIESAPSFAGLGVLKNATELADGSKSCGKAPLIVTNLILYAYRVDTYSYPC